MPDTQPSLPPGPLHRNQQLFSDYYLNEILPGRADWQGLAANAEPVRQRIAALMAAYHPSANEAQTEADLVRPILKALGHDFEVQPALKTPDGTKKPDYVFYRDMTSLQAHKNKTLTDAVAQQGAFAVGDAKYWDRPLDTTLAMKSGDIFSNKNPGYQIAFYIQHSGVQWGILTNGRLWRLYHRDTAHKLDRFYEVDLKALTDGDDPAAFLYFYAFFHRAAFEPQPLGVSAILAASEDYARGVGNTLKSQVYDALRHLAQGFLDYAPNGLTLDDATVRREVYDASLILLYRLLFVLYAEARELLPVRESPVYRDSYSLQSIKQDVARDLKTGKALLATSATLWPRLKELFRSIDQGNPPLKVATFNGGLFDPKRHPFLETHTVGDLRLQRAVDMLARVGGQFVDYRDLSVRHLGTIYEGLLEYRLQPDASEPGWTVALVNDKGERKATGSYYTPDDIVKYIVEQTVGPMLAEAVAGHTDDKAQVQAVLGVNVLDPAMGSGHFLVEATEFIARFLIDRAVLPGADSGGEADLLYWKRRVAQSCIYGVDLNPLAVELAKLSLWLTTVAKDRPLSFLDHHLRTGNALVGARLSDLQLGGKKPKRASKEAVREAEGQLSLMADSAFTQSMTKAVSNMWRIERNDAQTVADVKTQEALYAKLREDFTARYGRLADVVTATHFGLPIQPAFWKPFADYATRGGVAALPQFTQWLDAAQDSSHDRHFFHWELEFPEVYFDRFGKPLGDKAGFDAVIGNPPYIRQEELGLFKPYFATQYPEVYNGVADLYVYFFGQGLRQLQSGGLISYISSGTFRKLSFGGPLRKHLTSKATLLELIDFGNQQVFAGAVTYPVILRMRKQLPASDTTVLVKTADSIQTLSGKTLECALPTGEAPWSFTSTKLQHVIHGWKESVALSEIIKQPIYRGVTTGLNDAFVINQVTYDMLVTKDNAAKNIIKPFLRGEDLQTWYQADDKCWLIVFPATWTQKTFGKGLNEQNAWEKLVALHPSIAEYLAPNAEDARKRLDKGQYWWELRPCSYYSAFEQPRIHSTKISRYPAFSLSAETYYAANTSYVMPVPDTQMGNYLLGLLNSRVSEYFSRSVFAPKANGYYEVQPGELSKFPVPNTTDADRDALGTLATAITAQARSRYDLHQKARHRLLTDLGTPGGRLNNKLTAWWTLDLPALRAEVQKVFKHNIPLKDRDEWDEWLTAQRARHDAATAQIIAHETDLNARVYALFHLTPEEITVIEHSTKYRYGEV